MVVGPEGEKGARNYLTYRAGLAARLKPRTLRAFVVYACLVERDDATSHVTLIVLCMRLRIWDVRGIAIVFAHSTTCASSTRAELYSQVNIGTGVHEDLARPYAIHAGAMESDLPLCLSF